MTAVSQFSDVRAVLFDLDGTLIDSAPDLGAAVELMRQARGMPGLPLAQYRPMAGAGARGMLGVGFGMTPEHPDFNALREEFFSNYEQCLTQRTLVFPEVAELLDALVAQGLPWGVVTNKSARFTAHAATRMRKSSGPSAGDGASPSCRTDSSPGFSITIARM